MIYNENQETSSDGNGTAPLDVVNRCITVLFLTERAKVNRWLTAIRCFSPPLRTSIQSWTTSQPASLSKMCPSWTLSKYSFNTWTSTRKTIYSYTIHTAVKFEMPVTTKCLPGQKCLFSSDLRKCPGK